MYGARVPNVWGQGSKCMGPGFQMYGAGFHKCMEPGLNFVLLHKHKYSATVQLYKLVVPGDRGAVCSADEG